ncbi:MAG: MFS transporter [Deltaproteobacteria bacterium]|nr:MFS transporter [Deltaproteobacteria bacterium]
MTVRSKPRAGSPAGRETSRTALIAWAFYDWANNGFATVILTFIFSAYFIRRIAPDEVTGSALWGNMVSIAGLCIALGGPVCGAAADQNGRRKPWLIAFMLLSVLATALLWFVKPSPDYLRPALVLVGFGMVGAEYSYIFYNAMLPELAPPDRLGRWSGWGWGLGYAGGLLCLLAALLIMEGGGPGPAGGAPGSLVRIRAGFVLAGVWYLVFSLPLIFLVPDTRGLGKPFARAVRDGIGRLAEMVREVRRFRRIALFLVARMIYIDALATIFALGGVYAAGAFDMNEKAVLLFGVVLNVAAGLGALIFSGLDDRIGPKAIILISLGGLFTGALVILLVHAAPFFWAAGTFMGLFVGPVQAASRSYMARVAPEKMRNQMFGLYAFSGKATAFAGPFLVGWLTYLSGSQRIGMGTVPVLLAAGGLLMLKVPAAEE